MKKKQKKLSEFGGVVETNKRVSLIGASRALYGPHGARLLFQAISSVDYDSGRTNAPSPPTMTGCHVRPVSHRLLPTICNVFYCFIVENLQLDDVHEFNLSNEINLLNFVDAMVGEPVESFIYDSRLSQFRSPLPIQQVKSQSCDDATRHVKHVKLGRLLAAD